MKSKPLIYLFVLLALNINLLGQSKPAANYRVEDTPGELKININLWGYVNYPGRYEVPISTDIIQLITFAGGPKTHAIMDEVVIYRVDDKGHRVQLEVDLDSPEDTSPNDLILYDEDTIVVDYSSVIVWRDIFAFIAAPLAILASIAIIMDRLGK